MRKIKTAVIGAGFMGKTHTEGIRRLGNVEVAGVAAISKEEAEQFGRAMGIERTTQRLARPGRQGSHGSWQSRALREAPGNVRRRSA